MTKALCHIQTEQRGEVIIVTLLNREIIDPGQIHELESELFNLVNERRSLILVFDNVQSIFRAVLNKLIILNKKLEDNKTKLRMCNMRPEIYEVFSITHLNRLFDIKKSLDEAIQGF